MGGKTLVKVYHDKKTGDFILEMRQPERNKNIQLQRMKIEDDGTLYISLELHTENFEKLKLKVKRIFKKQTTK